ncbi:GntR family transcriptional regulator [Cryobacterium sp. SO2]|uniref:GntR family transcriptional regulator n=1 Tax=Cryobacterium sp. SO2 TaxID=1897060 RepID=UPI00223E0E29|nr:GntR family transcriptional regulator [Cryobacterium sp. SO2]WEO77855.1 GntR family transcriptional regulator [Cryobacterium sp. SO2]
MSVGMRDSTILEQIPSPDVMLGKTVHERVREALRTSVIEGILPPSFRLRQSDIATSLGVSVTPVREALRDLAAEGLIRMDAHRGAIVRSIDLAEFIEIRLLLDALWPVCVRLATERISDQEIAIMEALQAKMEKHPKDYVLLNAEFHEIISQAARAPRVQAMLDSLRVATNQVLRTALGTAAPNRLHEGIEEHRGILDALRRRDADAMILATMAHQTPTWDAVEAMIRSAQQENADV